MLPVLAIMIGDPARIGPEVAVKALTSGRPDETCVPILIGDPGTVEKAATMAGIELPVEVLDRLDDPAPAPGKLRVFNPSRVDLSACRFGEASEAAGRAVLDWHRAAMEYGRAARRTRRCSWMRTREGLRRRRYILKSYLCPSFHRSGEGR